MRRETLPSMPFVKENIIETAHSLAQDVDVAAATWFDGKHEGRVLNPEERTALRQALAEKILAVYSEDQSKKNEEKIPVLKPESLPALAASLQLVEQLRDLSTTDVRTCDPSIEAVMIFSGPGLFLAERKPDDQYQANTYRWLNRDRLLAGMAYARRIALEKKRVTEKNPDVTVRDLTAEDLEKYAPIIFYNGTALENKELEEVLNAWGEEGWDEEYAHQHEQIKKSPYPQKLPFPRDKFRIAAQPTRHTGEQVMSIAAETQNGQLKGLKNIATVATILDYVRLGNYLEKVSRVMGEDKAPSFWAYPVRARRGNPAHPELHDTVPQYLVSEAERLVHYLQAGHLAEKPVEFKNVSSH